LLKRWYKKLDIGKNLVKGGQKEKKCKKPGKN